MHDQGVGIDEKYVLVPKNDKPEAKMKQWMYVYFAVDCYTYDLLHVAIYPYNTKQSATAFLLALRAKGYHPRVVVTDLRVDYGPLVVQVFPKATYHECIPKVRMFLRSHALQDAHKHIKEVYGTDYVETHPQVETLREEIDHIFDARTKRTARRRYEQVLAQRETFVAQKRIRGKCPLELAGYEVLKLPMAQLFRGLALQWPALAFGKLVPNV